MGLFRQIIAALLPSRAEPPTSPEPSRKRKRDDNDAGPPQRQRTTRDYTTPARQVITEDALINYESESSTGSRTDSGLRDRRRYDTGDTADVFTTGRKSKESSEEEDSTRFTLDEDSFVSIDSNAPASTKQQSEAVPSFEIVPPALDGLPDTELLDRFRKEGWNDLHLQLISHYIHRGYEALLPASWKAPFSFMPANLFAEDDTPLLAMRTRPQHHGEIAFQRLLHLGAKLRGSIKPDDSCDGEKYTKRTMTQYIKEITKDTGLKDAIPLVSIAVGPETKDSKLIAAHATRLLQKLAHRWEEAFKAQGIDRQVPALYTIIGVGPVVLVAVRKPHDPTANLQTVIRLDFEEVDYDFWSVFALAILICHTRDQQIAIADETGVGKTGRDDADT